MKSMNEMELEDWEVLSDDDGYLEINEDGGKRVYSRKTPSPPTVFQMNYFVCPPKSVEITDNQLSPVPVDQDQISAVDPDPVSQVFFKKMKETEFVDMKLDSPKSPCSARGFMPHLGFQLDENQLDENREEEEGNNNNNDGLELEMVGGKSEKMELDGEDEGGINIWKLSLTGIGAICSFGVVAATFCIICLSTQNKNAQHDNRKLQFQIYTNEKRMKQVVHHASKLNEAITRAHITFGGYYDASV